MCVCVHTYSACVCVYVCVCVCVCVCVVIIQTHNLCYLHLGYILQMEVHTCSLAKIMCFVLYSHCPRWCSNFSTYILRFKISDCGFRFWPHSIKVKQMRDTCTYTQTHIHTQHTLHTTTQVIFIKAGKHPTLKPRELITLL